METLEHQLTDLVYITSYNQSVSRALFLEFANKNTDELGALYDLSGEAKTEYDFLAKRSSSDKNKADLIESYFEQYVPEQSRRKLYEGERIHLEEGFGPDFIEPAQYNNNGPRRASINVLGMEVDVSGKNNKEIAELFKSTLDTIIKNQCNNDIDVVEKICQNIYFKIPDIARIAYTNAEKSNVETFENASKLK